MRLEGTRLTVAEPEGVEVLDAALTCGSAVLFKLASAAHRCLCVTV